MLSGFIIGLGVGAVGFYLILRNNPGLARTFGFLIDTLDEKIDDLQEKE